MPSHSIALPALNRTVSVGQYVGAIKRAKANLAATFPSSLEHWAPAKGAQIVAEFRKGLAARINAKAPGYGQGRKWSEEWQVETLRAARALNTPRLAIHWLPQHLKARFAERLSAY